MALEITNLADSTLDGGINASVTTMNVVDGSSFPSSGDFWVRIDDEIIKVGARSSNTLSSLTRGISGGGASAAATHSSGATVTQVLTSQSVTQLRADITRQGTHAEMAALTDMKSGDVFWFDGSDTPYHRAIYNGSSWIYYFNGYKCTPLDTTGYAWDSGTNSASTVGGAVRIAVTTENSGGSPYIRVFYKAPPAAPYTVRMLVKVNYVSTGTAIYAISGASFGLSLIDTASGKRLTTGLDNSSTALTAANYFSGILTSTFVGTYGTWYGDLKQDWMWLEYEDDNTDRFERFSVDGVTWNQIATQSRTDYLTPNGIGPFAFNKSGSTLYCWVLSYEVS